MGKNNDTQENSAQQLKYEIKPVGGTNKTLMTALREKSDLIGLTYYATERQMGFNKVPQEVTSACNGKVHAMVKYWIANAVEKGAMSLEQALSHPFIFIPNFVSDDSRPKLNPENDGRTCLWMDGFILSLIGGKGEFVGYENIGVKKDAKNRRVSTSFFETEPGSGVVSKRDAQLAGIPLDECEDGVSILDYVIIAYGHAFILFVRNVDGTNKDYLSEEEAQVAITFLENFCEPSADVDYTIQCIRESARREEGSTPLELGTIRRNNSRGTPVTGGGRPWPNFVERRGY